MNHIAAYHIIILSVSFITILRSFSNSEDYYGDYYGDYDEESYDSNDSEETGNGWVCLVLNLLFCIFLSFIRLGRTNSRTFVLFIFSAKSAQAEVKVDQVYRQTNFESFFHGS